MPQEGRDHRLRGVSRRHSAHHRFVYDRVVNLREGPADRRTGNGAARCCNHFCAQAHLPDTHIAADIEADVPTPTMGQTMFRTTTLASRLDEIVRNRESARSRHFGQESLRLSPMDRGPLCASCYNRAVSAPTRARHSLHCMCACVPRVPCRSLRSHCALFEFGRPRRCRRGCCHRCCRVRSPCRRLAVVGPSVFVVLGRFRGVSSVALGALVAEPSHAFLAVLQPVV